MLEHENSGSIGFNEIFQFNAIFRLKIATYKGILTFSLERRDAARYPKKKIGGALRLIAIVCHKCIDLIWLSAAISSS